MREISKRMIEAGYKSSRGAFSQDLVATILDSNAYIGELTIMGKYSESGKDEIIKNDHEAIISNELNDKAKKRRAREKRVSDRAKKNRKKMEEEQ